jgi:anti-sigma regulatory factor (Ser/Thr protein kinase)
VDAPAGGCSAPSALSAHASPDAVAHHAPAGGYQGFRHVAALARSADHLLAVAVPFVQEGLRAGDLTVLACAPSTAARIGAVLGEPASGLVSDARLGLLGTRAPDALAELRSLARRAGDSGSGRLRVLAEVQVTSTERDRREGVRYEAASNAVLASAPITALCLYDGSRLPSGSEAEMRATHPLLVEDGGVRRNDDYRDPRAFVGSLPLPREPVEAATPVLVVDDARSLPDLRHALAAVVDTWVRDPEQQADLRLGLAEVAANAFRHGSRPVSARVWVEPGRMVCTVSDRGSRPVDPLAGFVPAHGDDLSRGGMGLWLARKLFDNVDLIPGPAGLTVRLAAHLR